MSASARVRSGDARRILGTALQTFEDVFGTENANNVLLEDLTYEPSSDASPAVWRVTIGFDTARQRERPGNVLVGIKSATEPVRESRTLILDAETGALIGIKSE